ELARIRREMETQRRAIQESLRGYLRRLAEGGTVQDELITIRGERFVSPVKVEQKRRVQGVVHGASSSGQTVFVEPLETIEQNNELVRLLEEEQAEIHRILQDMTQRIGAKSVTLKTIGLLALMAQSGLPVPADRAELPVFDAVLADIGDYQSIEQNLSTFSAHVTNIDFISRTASNNSLVLLDELGSATD